MINEVLRKIALSEQVRTQVAQVSIAKDATTPEALQQTELGTWLVQLTEIAEHGELGSISLKEARDMLDRLYQALCQAPFQEYALIPPKFDKSPLGEILNQVRVYTLGLGDVINVAEAAKLTQVQRGQIYFLIFGGVLHPIEINGKVMIERRHLSRIEEYKKSEKS